jgi:membrane protein
MDQAARGRDADGPSQIPRLGWRDILWRTWSETSADNIGMVAAGVAFYAFLALVPTLGATVLIYGLIADPAEVGRHLRTLFNLLPADAAKLVGEQLVSITKASADKTGLGLGVALLLAIYGAMKGANATITALNIAYEEEEGRSFLHRTLVAVGITLGTILVGVFGALAIAALAFLEALIPEAPGGVKLMIRIAFWAAAAIAASAVIAVVYRYAPDRDPAKWRWLTPGAILATLGWLAMTLAFGLYAANVAHYNATYGALGAVVALLMWLYLSAYIFLVGAELNSETERQTAKDTTRGRAEPIGDRTPQVTDRIGAEP